MVQRAASAHGNECNFAVCRVAQESKLSNNGKINMTTACKAIIEGKRHIVRWKNDLLLVDKVPHIVEPMGMTLAKFQDYTLLFVSKLKFNGGSDWLVDGETPTQRVFHALRNGRTETTRTKAERFDLLGKILNGVPRVLPAGKESPLSELKYPPPSELINAMAVAWVKEFCVPFHGFQGVRITGEAYPKFNAPLPIFLSAFKPYQQRAGNGQHAKSKPVARFENDCSVAMIPQKSGKEMPLTIEPELLGLIKKIIAAGGNMPRTKLRNGKSDTYQPEKLLMSKAAKALIKAKLLGTNKSGRTTVFWAKQCAA